jgi:hypothetical protein
VSTVEHDAEKDELLIELGKGRHFDSWSEGLVTFSPT